MPKINILVICWLVWISNWLALLNYLIQIDFMRYWYEVEDLVQDCKIKIQVRFLRDKCMFKIISWESQCELALSLQIHISYCISLFALTMRFVHKKERILISKIYTANIKLILAFRVSGFVGHFRGQSWRLVKRRHPEIALVVPSVSSSQRGQPPILLFRRELSVMLLGHELPVMLLDAPLPVILLLSKHPVLLLSEEASVVRARVTSGALPSIKY